jgi:hypothetical protein
MQKETLYSDKDEEIDLVNLFKKSWRLFKRRLKIFWVFIITGIVLAVAYYKFMPPTFKSRMIISSSVFQGASFVIILDNLQQLIKEGNYEELSTVLGMDLNTAKKIKNIEVYSSKNYAEMEFGDKITFEKEKVLSTEEKKEEKKEEFVIEAFVADNSVFKPLEDGIVFYLNSNPSLKESGIAKKQGLNEMKHSILKQRMELDSLKRFFVAVFNKKETPANFFIGDPGGMYTSMVELYEDELRASEGLFASNINIIENFRIYKKQYSPKLGLSLAIFTFAFLFFFMMTVIILEANRKKEIE